MRGGIPSGGGHAREACNSVLSASSPRPRAGRRRCVERCWPVTRHARRSDNSRRSCNMQTASRRRDGLTQFPPGDLLERVDLEFLVGDDPLQPRVLALQLAQPFGVVGLHPAVLVAPAVVGRSEISTRLAASAIVCPSSEQPLHLPQLAHNLLRRVPSVVSPRCPPPPTFAGQRTLINGGLASRDQVRCTPHSSSALRPPSAGAGLTLLRRVPASFHRDVLLRPPSRAKGLSSTVVSSHVHPAHAVRVDATVVGVDQAVDGALGVVGGHTERLEDVVDRLAHAAESTRTATSSEMRNCLSMAGSLAATDLGESPEREYNAASLCALWGLRPSTIAMTKE